MDAAPLRIEPADRDESAGIRDELRRGGRMWEDVDLDRSLFLVCRDGGRRIGWVGLEVDGEGALLRSLYTEPASRKHGIGRRLVEAAEREAVRRGARVMVLFSTEAGGYFRALGYEEIPVPEAVATVPRTPQVLWYLDRPHLLDVEVTYRKPLEERAMPTLELETARLRLRPLALGDVDALARIWTDPEVSRLLLTRPRDRVEVEGRLRAMLEHARLWGMWAIELRDARELVGRCGFYPYAGEGALAGGPEPELAFFLAREQWGRGLATEAARAALDALRPHRPERVVALVHPENTASRRVLEKLGMRADRRVAVQGGEALLYAKRGR
jgi:RimJ/RimL family protein N-acetyltransferase/N-acetylglutamate synthase-like GNAT family acetyltransferase